MRGFRTNRAVTNFKSSHFGNNPTQPTKFKVIQGGAQTNQTQNQQHQVQIPDWMKAPKSLIESQKTDQKPKSRPKLHLVSSSEVSRSKSKKAAKASSVKRAVKTAATKSRSRKAA